MKTSRLLVTIGTRPEAVKMAPVIRELTERAWAQVRVLVTAQHRDMLDPVLDFFGVEADADLDLMREGQSLAGLTGRMIPAVDGVLEREGPDLVLVQGDTTTAMATALACHYRDIPVGHVEAGLRTGDRTRPFPEEMNRRLIGQLAALHFAPTERAAGNLRAEGIGEKNIHVTGNPVVDALLSVRGKIEERASGSREKKRVILVTAHRRENFGEPLEQLCRALLTLAEREDVCVLVPVHANPAVRETIRSRLGQHPDIRLVEPMGYLDFLTAMQRASLILTDSGGVQEEAPSLGRPVLVLREETERPEAIEAGAALLVGMSADRIVEQATRLLEDESAWKSMVGVPNPFGDGRAAERICDILESQFVSG